MRRMRGVARGGVAAHDERMPQDTPSGIVPGQQLFGRYVARQFVRRSQRSELWIGEDREARRWVQLVGWSQSVRADRERYGRLKVALMKAAQLKHPNLVRVLDLLDDGAQAVLVMEAPEGRTWEQMHRERRPRPFEPEEIVRAVGEICAALEDAWGTLQLAHGSVRPVQVIICPDGSAKLQGFGLAPEIVPGEEPVGWQEGIEEHLIYLSPERLRGGQPGPRDDVYALGMSLYRMIVGRPPYLVRSVADALRQTDPPSLTDQRLALGIEGDPIPPAWEQVVLDCLARDPGRRPASAGEVARRLSGQPEAAPPPTLAAFRRDLIGQADDPGAVGPRIPPKVSPPILAPTPGPKHPESAAASIAGAAPESAAGQPSRMPQLFTPFQVPAPKPGTEPGALPVSKERPPLPKARDPKSEAEREAGSKKDRRPSGPGHAAKWVAAIAALVCIAGVTFRFGLVERARAPFGGASPAPKAAVPGDRSHLAAGQALFGEAKIEAAVSEFSLALQGGEDRAEALYWRGRCYIAAKNFDAAIGELGAALEARPGFAMAHLFRGFALGKVGRLAEALEDFNMAIAADPSLAEAYHHRGSTLLELGQHEKALEDLNRVVASKPGFAAYYDRGLAHFHLARLAESIADFDEAIKENPKFAPALYNRGSVYFQMGRYRDAVRDFSEAVKVNPRYESAYYMRGVASHRLGDHLRAIEDLSEAIRLRGDFREAWEQRGFARLAAGDYHKANEDFEAARKLAGAAGTPSAAGAGAEVAPASGPGPSQRLLDPRALIGQPPAAGQAP